MIDIDGEVDRLIESVNENLLESIKHLTETSGDWPADESGQSASKSINTHDLRRAAEIVNGERVP